MEVAEPTIDPEVDPKTPSLELSTVNWVDGGEA